MVEKKLNLQYSLDPADAPEFVSGPQEFQFPPEIPEPGAAVGAAFDELYMSKIHRHHKLSYYRTKMLYCLPYAEPYP